MPVTLEQVKAQLIPIEPDYEKAAELGRDAITHLKQLAESDDMILAPRAVYLASLIGGDRSVSMLRNAADSSFLEVRIQAAGGARNLPKETAKKILLKVLNDSDARVRNAALKSVKALSATGALPKTVQKKISVMSNTDPEQFIRESSNNLLRHLHSR